MARVEALGRRAAQLHAEGKYREAASVGREALADGEEVFGPESLDVAILLNNLGSMVQASGDLAEARTHFDRALAIRERSLGADHLDVATVLNNLGLLLQAQGALDDARTRFERALAIRERALGPDHVQVARSQTNLAGVLRELGEPVPAQALAERSLRTRERALGPEHPDVAATLNVLGLLLQDQGRSRAAQAALERALAIRERALGPTHPSVAVSLNNLARLLHTEGASTRARTLLERSLRVREQALGPDHPSMAVALLNLAAMLQDQGAYLEARLLAERALALAEALRASDSGLLASCSTILGAILRSLGELEGARSQYERALALRESALGPTHLTVAGILSDFGGLLRALGALDEARAAFEKSLALRERALGADHPDVAVSLNGLGLVLHLQGRHEEAAARIARALEIVESALGPDHPNSAAALLNQADCFLARAELTEAARCFRESLVRTARRLRTEFQGLTPRERLAASRAVRYRLSRWLDFAPRVGQDGLAETLEFQGIVARLDAAERARSRRASPAGAALQDALRAAGREVSRLASARPPATAPKAVARWQRRYAEAAARRERLQRALLASSEHGPDSSESGLPRGNDVASALAAGEALVNVLRTDDRYVAWVLRPGRPSSRIDLGASDQVDAACEAFVEAIVRADALAVAETGAALRGAVWDPLSSALGADVRRVFVSPDAALAAVPLGALPGDASGACLLDGIAMSYVRHPSDLAREERASPTAAGALLAGGIDFETAAAGGVLTGAAQRPDALLAADRAPQGDAFRPLPASRREVEALAAHLAPAPATLLLGSAASESRLRQEAPGKRYLHLATHGFSRSDVLAGLRRRTVGSPWTTADEERQLAVGHDPMLLSGLALAGANPRDGGDGDDGILTALEASYLDLDGCELVTLSACDTAKGTAESGEGVLGLVSAFQMAGARHVVASLWKVDDEATRLLMEAFYERLLRKENPLPPAEALREASLWLRDWKDAEGKRRYAAPRYWAAFVAYGG